MRTALKYYYYHSSGGDTPSDSDVLYEDGTTAKYEDNTNVQYE